MAEQGAILGFGVGERIDMSARDHEDMNRRLRMKVREGVALVVLVDGRGRDGPVNDLAKDAAHGVISVQERQLV
jgi:hypothetical protein